MWLLANGFCSDSLVVWLNDLQLYDHNSTVVRLQVLQLYNHSSTVVRLQGLQSYNYRFFSYRKTGNMANEVLNSSISISRLYSNQYQKSGYKFLQNRQIKPSASNVGLLQAPISWSTHAQQVLCERISAVMQAHNSCCAAYGVNFSDNLYYLFRQLHLSFPTTSSVFSDCILRLRTFIEVVHVS